jgi:hypothetical protein
VRDLLLNNTEAKNRVYIGRTVPTKTDEPNALPILLIYSIDEDVRRFNQAPKNYRRNLTVNIECIDTGNTDDDLDRRLEVLAETVEDLMEKDERLGLKEVNFLELTGANYQAQADGESPFGSLILTYNVEYFRDAILEGAACLDDLKVIDTKWKVGHQGPLSPTDIQVDANDKVEY